MFCKNGREIQVGSCYLGFGLFAISDNGEEVCQICTKFTANAEDAELLPYDNQKAPVNLKCNRNGSCFL